MAKYAIANIGYKIFTQAQSLSNLVASRSTQYH